MKARASYFCPNSAFFSMPKALGKGSGCEKLKSTSMDSIGIRADDA